MFTISNLIKRKQNGWTYLQCNFDVSGIDSPFDEKHIWVAVEDANADMLTDETYDAFVLVPLMLGIYYNQDVHIEGTVSPRLYHNIQHYLIPILSNFAGKKPKAKFSVAQVGKIDLPVGDIVGTGVSCGVDSLVTIYDNYVEEHNPEMRINGLFLFNCGTHGDFEDSQSRKIWLDRSALNKHCADALGLPMYVMDTNFHAFTHKVGENKLGYLAIYSCALAFQKVVRRYLTSSNLSYNQIADSREIAQDYDFAEFCESYMPHLVSTERFELVIDGCQYTRGEKVERISDWNIAQRYVNVCITPVEHGKNCSQCEKCMITLLPLEAIGKADAFNKAFNLQIYHQHVSKFKRELVSQVGHAPLNSSIVFYCKEKGLPMPGIAFSKCYMFLRRTIWNILKIFKMR